MEKEDTIIFVYGFICLWSLDGDGSDCNYTIRYNQLVNRRSGTGTVVPIFETHWIYFRNGKYHHNKFINILIIYSIFLCSPNHTFLFHLRFEYSYLSFYTSIHTYILKCSNIACPYVLSAHDYPYRCFRMMKNTDKQTTLVRELPYPHIHIIFCVFTLFSLVLFTYTRIYSSLFILH